MIAAACDGSARSDDPTREAPWWLLIVVGAAIVVLLVAFVRRGSKVPKVNPTSWKTDARTGYANARWLYDAMGEDLAVWRGNALVVTGTTNEKPQPVAASSRFSEHWGALDRRYGEASDALYRLEVGAPDRRSASTALTALTAIRTVRRALDRRADARFGYRTVAASTTNADELAASREQEVRASMELADARRILADALDELAIVAGERSIYGSAG